MLTKKPLLLEMTERFLYLFFSLILWVLPLQATPKTLCIDDEKKAKILEGFLRLGIKEEEYGYVLEGVKPLSIRNFYGLGEFPISSSIEREEEQFKNTLLVQSALPIWNTFCSHQKKFVLKALPLNTADPITSTLEVQLVNTDKLTEVIENNINLFRYILGPSVQTGQLVHEIAYSDKPLEDLLKGNLVLTGIVLGFGSHNSLVGGRIEEIVSSSISKDSPPFSPKSYLMEERGDHSLSVLSAKTYGYYYLDFAGGEQEELSQNPPCRIELHGSNMLQELRALDALEEPLPSCLRKARPLLIFGAYKGGPSNQPLFNQLKQAQKRVQKLLKQSDFLETVLEKIVSEKPLVSTSKDAVSYSSAFCNPLDAQQWKQLILNVAQQFKEKEDQSAFIQAFLHPYQSAQASPKLIGASQATLKGLEKALQNLEIANTQFETFSLDPSLQVIAPSKLYFKITQPGSGKRLSKEDRVRLGYVIEDLQGEVLFANHDTWIFLSETVQGFAHGIQGMHLGEKRAFFVHPTLAYGVLTTLPPCIGLKIQVHLIDIDENSDGILPLLQPLDLNWIKDPSFYRDIKESIDQRPRFMGAFYRKMLDKIEVSDKIVNSL